MSASVPASTLSKKIYNRYTSIVGGLVSLFSPSAAGRFVQDRTIYREYAAGMISDADKNFRPRMRSGDANVKRAQKLVAARCRDQAENNALISGGIERICNNVVRNGIHPKFKFRKKDESLDAAANRAWKKLYTRWARYCDVLGHDSRGALQKLGLRHMWTDGQYFIHRVYDTTLPGIVPLRLEYLEFDQLDATVDGDLANGNIARKGIEYDKSGRPLYYNFYLQHPGDYLALGMRMETRRIPASEIIHVWDRKRISQYSGISWLAAVVMESYRMEDFRHITQDKARLETIFGAFLKTSMPGFNLGGGLQFGGQSAPGGTGDTGTSDAPTEISQGPVIQKLPNSTELQFTPPSTPGNNYEPFTKDSSRYQSAGIGMSFEAYTNNYTDSSYASARSGSLEERLSYRGQQQIIDEQDNRKVMAWFIEAAWLAGLHPHSMTGYAKDPLYYHEMVEGQFPGWGWVDPQNDANAAEKQIDLTLDTHHNQAAQRGNDWDETIDTLLDEEDRKLELAKKRAERKRLEEENSNASE